LGGLGVCEANFVDLADLIRSIAIDGDRGTLDGNICTLDDRMLPMEPGEQIIQESEQE